MTPRNVFTTLYLLHTLWMDPLSQSVHYIWLERLARDKHSSLWVHSLILRKWSVLNIVPGILFTKLHFQHTS
jgi:hypothetical protein